MPLLEFGSERFALQAGMYTLGGHGPNAVPLTVLERSPEVAEIVVPESGPSTIQRLMASIVVRVDQTPIGIEPKPLADGVAVEFNGCRLTFRIDDARAATVVSESAGEEPDNARTTPDRPRWPQESTTQAAASAKARLVSARTGNAVDLGDYRVVVGRDDACDLVVPGTGVSRRHCSITPVRGGYLLRDESSNGTLVNGSPVSGTYLLGHGDIVRIGEEELRLEVIGGPARTSTATAAPTMILDLSRLRSGDAPAETGERTAARLVANLEIVRGPYSGASFPIDRPVCSIGRSIESDVQIRDESISANHATLLRKGTTWFVVDLRSANGTFVDGLRIAGERELTSGSRLRLGRVELSFRALDPSAETANAANGTPRARSRLRELLGPLFARNRRSPRALSEDL